MGDGPIFVAISEYLNFTCSQKDEGITKIMHFI